jgi:type VI secretion system secreted protein VgrG
MGIDIRAGVIAATILTGIFFLISFITGLQTVLEGRKIKFFQLRLDQTKRGWRLIILGLLWVVLGFGVYFYGEPLAYQVITPSPTLPASMTPSITPEPSLTPTITDTPTITLTPAESYTPEPTQTPHIPVAVEARFDGKLTPPPDAAFSSLVFTNIGLDDDYNPIGPGIQFTNPVGHLYAVFSYAQMEENIQWSALWLHQSKLVYYESYPWQWPSGGYGFTDWDPAPELWQPGEYEIQLFLGTDYILSGFFTVVGDPPTPTITPTQTLSPTPTQSP